MSFTYWLRLRGLPFNSTAVDVCRFLKDVRMQGGADGVYFGVSPAGKPSGEAFVEVLTELEVEKALNHHKATIGNRYIEVYASSEDEMWRKTERGRKPGYFIRLRGLPFGCLKEDIKTFFEGCYIRPRGITLLLDKMERCNGGAYVEFATKKGYESALARHRAMMGERYVEVFDSSEEELNQLIQKSGDGVRGFSIMVGGGGMRGDRGGMRGDRGGMRGDRGGMRGDRGGRNTRDHGNSPNNLEREGREPAFRGGRGDPHGMPMFRGGGGGGGGGRGRGPAGLEFMDRRPDGRELRQPMMEEIRFAQPVAARMPEPPPPATVEHRVHVRGMPPSANAADLTKLFYPIAVMNVLLVNDDSGRPCGEADVFFNSHSEAVRALEVNRNMGNVRLDFYLHSEPGPADRIRSGGQASSAALSGGAIASGDGGGGSAFNGSGSLGFDSRYGDMDRGRGGGFGGGSTGVAGQYSHGSYGSGGGGGGGAHRGSGSLRPEGSSRMGSSGGGGGYGYGGRRY